MVLKHYAHGPHYPVPISGPNLLTKAPNVKCNLFATLYVVEYKMANIVNAKSTDNKNASKLRLFIANIYM